MTAADRLVLGTLPAAVLKTLADFENTFGASLRLIVPPPEPGPASEVVYASGTFQDDAMGDGFTTRSITSDDGPPLELHMALADRPAEPMAAFLCSVLERAFESAREIDFFTYELSERFEETNLVYSISEILGATLDLADGANQILAEVCDVMGANRGSLWVYEPDDDQLHLHAQVGEDGREGPLNPDDPDAVTSRVFRDGQPSVVSRPMRDERGDGIEGDESHLSVPIRYQRRGESRKLGVVNLIGRQDNSPFSAAHQKLLVAIAFQIGAVLENIRLVRESVSKERMAKEMELAHDLQMKLLPALEQFDWIEAGGRVDPAEQVGGDFYQVFKLPAGRIGVMLGDVSLHGFPSALIMTLTLSVAGLYAREFMSPAKVLRLLDDALAEELETTEMFLTVFYGVLDPQSGTLTYSNAGHPHAFAIRDDGTAERLTATDPPVGFAGPDSYLETSVPWARERDLLLLFTDGLSDMLASNTRTDGEGLILETAIRSRYRAATEIVDCLFALSSDEDSLPALLGDYRTVLVVRV
ncbi:MAG: GAF domain-containing SpoIIE family protein phosphatase [Gemmatimonadota bacterium]|nr:GAF domain-containing SpoIIE family protein phosphatase [Gemmatimonadota bacterium]